MFQSDKMIPPRVSIILLNWKGWKDTIECLESLYRIEYPAYEVIVVDNDSQDDSVQKIKDYCEGKLAIESAFFKYDKENKPIEYIEYSEKEIPDLESSSYDPFSGKRLMLIKNAKNHGFAEGNNVGIRYALRVSKPEYILLLNNDTVVDACFLSELVKTAEEKDAGCVGPKTYYYNYCDRTDVISFAGGKLDMWKGNSPHVGARETDLGQYDIMREVDYVEGSCMLIKRKTLNDVGLLYSDYFLYWEEADWCVRAHKKGYKLIYAPKSKIWHKVSGSNKRLTGLQEYYVTRNMFWFMKKNASRKQYTFFLIYFFLWKLWYKSAIHLVYHPNIKIFRSIVKGVKDGLAWKLQDINQESK